MVGRRSLADYGVTSGVSIYRRDALEWALEQHSMSIYAEDLENTVVLLHAGERIYYDGRLVVSTAGRTLCAAGTRSGWAGTTASSGYTRSVRASCGVSGGVLPLQCTTSSATWACSDSGCTCSGSRAQRCCS